MKNKNTKKKKTQTQSKRNKQIKQNTHKKRKKKAKGTNNATTYTKNITKPSAFIKRDKRCRSLYKATSADKASNLSLYIYSQQQ